MANDENAREVLAAALSAHVSEQRLFWRETNMYCKWLVPESEHCYVGKDLLRYLRDFSEHAEDIVNESVRAEWLERVKPILDVEEQAPCPLRVLTWLIRVVESPHRDDLSTDSWNLYLWNVRLQDLATPIIRKLVSFLESQGGKVSVIDLDTLISRFVVALGNSRPSDTKKQDDMSRMLLLQRFDRLRRFKNLIFYGVSNIGKANLSKQLISEWKSMTGREIGAHCVTVFHGNTSYEDMIERRIDSGAPRFLISDGGDMSSPVVNAAHIRDARYFFEYADCDVQEGLFLALCRAAAHNPDKDYVFMIDCIDNARVSDVFGEVAHMLDSFARVPWKIGSDGKGAWDLEATGARSVRLTRSGRIFFIPSNVYVLGTANEDGIWQNSTDSRIIHTFALEHLDCMNAEELTFAMLAHRDAVSYARLEDYVKHSVELWNQINAHLVSAGGQRNIMGYGPLFSMCEEILMSSDVQDANRIVLGTWRYRMLPPIIQKMEQMLLQSSTDEMGVRRAILDQIIETLNQSWLRISVAIEGVTPYESISVRCEKDPVF